MKKNVMMRLASGLLVAVLLTTCAISGTFAKYVTSGDAQDTARVAKWGVVVDATGDDAFATTYNDTAPGTQVVSRLTLDGADGTASNVVAPGTEGKLGSISITGKPEVVVDVEVSANLSLNGWTIDTGDYCPLEFKVGGTIYKIGTGTAPAGYTYVASIAELETAVENAFIGLSQTNVPANTDLEDKNVSIDWAWEFEGNDDVKDTKLGNLNTLPSVLFDCSVTVTQVD